MRRAFWKALDRWLFARGWDDAADWCNRRAARLRRRRTGYPFND